MFKIMNMHKRNNTKGMYATYSFHRAMGLLCVSNLQFYDKNSIAHLHSAIFPKRCSNTLTFHTNFFFLLLQGFYQYLQISQGIPNIPRSQHFPAPPGVAILDLTQSEMVAPKSKLWDFCKIQEGGTGHCGLNSALMSVPWHPKMWYTS